MRISIFNAIFILSCASVVAQEIPNGVRYKKAPDAINTSTKANLESSLVSDTLPANVFGEVTVVGPMLWKSIKPSADKLLLAMKPVFVVIPGQTAFSAEGKTIRTGDERNAFWKLFRSKYPNLKDGKVRKGNAQEISYYWATIPFDIEEPFWVIDTGTERFITNFNVVGDKARLLWIDRVDDLQTLRP